ncbi:AraC family transcriptional regulator [Mucilaginibacter sp. JRF]|uniref:AraC family transcriptional regulator n=1 Tax=Mucilaginibacter sp. JRF TaxID=2780088 RepID=UPI00187E854C|nr:AraC family transcriptional regulator [Mucilaginibacter sp. JRF]MBE9586643.1 AraC family transcriptional regulator [Mucilaginibacter sp. JRF]
MINYIKYLRTDRKNDDLGLSIVNTGCTRIKVADEYPLKRHPLPHCFNWEDWRVLQEYQIIYIAKGYGLFESESVSLTRVKPGTIIFLFPNERHRYKPDHDKGWDEYWVGVQGKMIDSLYTSGFIRPEVACFQVGYKQRIRDMFKAIMDGTRKEQKSYTPAVTGAVINLIQEYHAGVKQSQVMHSTEYKMMDKARELFSANLYKPYSPEQAAIDLNLSYSTFRRLFKLHWGVPPGQYFLQQKINKAAGLIKQDKLLMKEICALLNFDSVHYFSRVFKEKMGCTPTQYRNYPIVKT